MLSRIVEIGRWNSLHMSDKVIPMIASEVFAPPGPILARSSAVTLSNVAYICAVLATSFALQLNKGHFHPKALLAIVVAIGFCAAAIAGPRIAVLLPYSPHRFLRRAFLVMVAMYLAVGVAILRYQHPIIDVLLFETDSVHALLHGQNPYGRAVTHIDLSSPGRVIYGPGVSTRGRVHVGFPYPPLTLFGALPGYIVGDVRYSCLATVVLSALLIFSLAPDLKGFVVALLLLLAPETHFVLKMGWTEPLVLLTLAATIVSAHKWPMMLPVALGLFLASKQYTLLAVPLAVLLFPKFSWKAYLSLIAKAGAIAAVVTVPFAFLDAQGCWRSLVTFQIAQPLRLDALSYSALLVRHSLPPIPQWSVVLAVVLSIGFALKWASRTPSAFAGSLALVLLVFFVLNKQAFCNYYFFCAGALCLSAASPDSASSIFMLIKLPAAAT